ncbi:MAG: methyltransferase domain-containing protein [Bdellovibrionales bacterium]|nr:methyltransferase domain-containing protein [Bdellovibrionales bacterium]
MWDERYKDEKYMYGTEPNDFLKEQGQRIPKGGHVLCIADGEGRNSTWLAEMGYHVTAIDSSQRGVEKAKRLAQDKNVIVQHICGDLSDTPLFEQKWDGIVSIFCHLPSALRERIHRQAVDSLNPKGVFLLEAYTPNQIPYGTGGPKDPDLLLKAQKAKSELLGLEFEILREVEREIHEGDGHNGLSHVTQILGVKS